MEARGRKYAASAAGSGSSGSSSRFRRARSARASITTERGCYMFEPERHLRERPEKEPKFSSLKGVEGSLLVGSDAYKIYNLLKSKPKGAFVAREVRKDLELKQDDKHVGDSMATLAKKGYIFRFPVLCRAIGLRGSYIYSFSEAAVRERFWKEVPQTVIKILTDIYNSPRKIFNRQEIIDAYDIESEEVSNWLYLCFYRDWKEAFGEPLVQTKTIGQKFRTFFYNPTINDFIFQKLYEQYYKERIISEKKLLKVKSSDFENFSVWVFQQYMRIKGLNLETIRCDKEPVDFISRLIINIEDILYKSYAQKEKELVKFAISCKNLRFDRPIGTGYVLGMLGLLRMGKTMRGEEIFKPDNAVGVIMCTRASPSAHVVANQHGMMIWDLDRILRAAEIVSQSIGEVHPMYDTIRLKYEHYRELRKGGGRVAVPAV